jgi:hypothetical protein
MARSGLSAAKPSATPKLEVGEELERLGSQIREFFGALFTAEGRALKAGPLLLEAQALCREHRIKWKSFLTDHCGGLPERTARKWMGYSSAGVTPAKIAEYGGAERAYRELRGKPSSSSQSRPSATDTIKRAFATVDEKAQAQVIMELYNSSEDAVKAEFDRLYAKLNRQQRQLTAVSAAPSHMQH